jgi:hypothetical protein
MHKKAEIKKIKRQVHGLQLVPQNNGKTMLTKRHPLSLEETRVLKRLVTALKEYPINFNLDCGTKNRTHRTYKATPTPLPTKGLHSLHLIRDTGLALPTFR